MLIRTSATAAAHGDEISPAKRPAGDSHPSSIPWCALGSASVRTESRRVRTESRRAVPRGGASTGRAAAGRAAAVRAGARQLDATARRAVPRGDACRPRAAAVRAGATARRDSSTCGASWRRAPASSGRGCIRLPSCPRRAAAGRGRRPRQPSPSPSPSRCRLPWTRRARRSPKRREEELSDCAGSLRIGVLQRPRKRRVGQRRVQRELRQRRVRE